MPLPFILALAMSQDQQTPAQQVVQEATDFSKPYEIIQPERISLTPRIDGKLEEEEWDELGAAGPGKAFFEWEPGMFHAAIRAPEGRDLCFSFDLKSNGWLIGNDNLEVRVTPGPDKPVVKARILDATKITGPTWVDIAGFTQSSEVAARTEEGYTTYEVTIRDPGLGILPTDENATLSLRADAPKADEAAFAPFLPRVCTPIKLVMQRAVALPAGLKFNTEGLGKTVAPGEFLRMRLTFNGNNNMNLSKLSLRSEGLAKDGTNKLELPFPKFDNKGRAFVDYATNVADTVPLGYKILRAELTTADGLQSLMQSAYRVAPPVDFDIVLQNTPVAGNDRSIKYTYYVRSNGGKAQKGDMSIVVPAPLRVLNATGNSIQLASNQRTRNSFELFIPANTVGTFPIKFKGTLNGAPYEQTDYITIGGV